MSKNFGLPYMGSKNRIAKQIITEIMCNKQNDKIDIE